jgi:serine protease Do
MRQRFSTAMSFGVCVVFATLALTLALTPGPADAQQLQMMPASQAEMIRGLLPTVVNITSFVIDTPDSTTMNAARSTTNPDPGHPKTTQGSGFIINQDGVILTNNHVIAGAYDIEVMFSDGARVPGRVLATSPRIDLALVKIETNHPLAVVRWADSDKLQIAEPVFAIGNPLGVGLSVTSGIISALNRNIMDTPYDDFIQTDAAINHGNSGGPLFNRNGEVIGIDTAILSPTAGSAGIGFAIPSNDARFCATRLLREGSVRPGYLGMKIAGMTNDMAAALGLPAPVGSIISVVHEGGPADAAGLQVGDVILRYDNQAPTDERALMRDIAKSTIGQPVPITIIHAGREQTLNVTPSEWPGTVVPTNAVPGQTPKPTVLVPPNLGLSLSALTADLRAQYGLHMQQAGVLLGGVAAGTDAFDRGMAPGDVILRVQETAVTSPQDVQEAVEAARRQHKDFILALVLRKDPQNADPRWIALRVGG